MGRKQTLALGPFQILEPPGGMQVKGKHRARKAEDKPAKEQ
jgi:hypothetical protein